MIALYILLSYFWGCYLMRDIRDTKIVVLLSLGLSVLVCYILSGMMV